MKSLLSPGNSLIGSEYDEGIVVLPGFLEGLDQLPDPLVDCEHSLVVLSLEGMDVRAVNEFSAYGTPGKPACLEDGQAIWSGDPLFLVPRVYSTARSRGFLVARIFEQLFLTSYFVWIYSTV